MPRVVAIVAQGPLKYRQKLLMMREPRRLLFLVEIEERLAHLIVGTVARSPLVYREKLLLMMREPRPLPFAVEIEERLLRRCR